MVRPREKGLREKYLIERGKFNKKGNFEIQNSIPLCCFSVQPDIPLMPNCVGSCWHYRSPYTIVQYGHLFISDIFFSQPFNNDPSMNRTILIAPRRWWDWDNIPYANFTLSIPNVRALSMNI